MSDDGKSTGNLFVNDYKKARNQPDFTGYLEINRTQIEALVKAGRAGQEVKLKIGCWKYPSKRDPEQDRLFLVAEPPDAKPKASDGWDDRPQRKSKPEPVEDDWEDDDIPF